MSRGGEVSLHIKKDEPFMPEHEHLDNIPHEAIYAGGAHHVIDTIEISPLTQAGFGNKVMFQYRNTSLDVVCGALLVGEVGAGVIAGGAGPFAIQDHFADSFLKSASFNPSSSAEPYNYNEREMDLRLPNAILLEDRDEAQSKNIMHIRNQSLATRTAHVTSGFEFLLDLKQIFPFFKNHPKKPTTGLYGKTRDTWTFEFEPHRYIDLLNFTTIPTTATATLNLKLVFYGEHYKKEALDFVYQQYFGVTPHPKQVFGNAEPDKGRIDYWAHCEYSTRETVAAGSTTARIQLRTFNTSDISYLFFCLRPVSTFTRSNGAYAPQNLMDATIHRATDHADTLYEFEVADGGRTYWKLQRAAENLYYQRYRYHPAAHTGIIQPVDGARVFVVSHDRTWQHDITEGYHGTIDMTNNNAELTLTFNGALTEDFICDVGAVTPNGIQWWADDNMYGHFKLVHRGNRR